MRVPIPGRIDKYANHLWFAWHPVIIQGHVVWLERVVRCYEDGGWGSDYATYEFIGAKV